MKPTPSLTYAGNQFVFVSGEVERLLKAYRQNREMVRNIGAHYYQIIYPVQLRHHEKMGISTREIGSKVRKQVIIFHFLACHISINHGLSACS